MTHILNEIESPGSGSSYVCVGEARETKTLQDLREGDTGTQTVLATTRESRPFRYTNKCLP